jgi:L-alanine-DL-glutamate epimerase-like enolase superfamily enzyme
LKIQFELLPLHLLLRYAWRLSRNSTTFKDNFIIRASRGAFAGLGEIAPNIRYGETPELISSQFSSQKKQAESEAEKPEWSDWVKSQTICQSLKMGLDMALTRLFAAEKGQSLATFLDLPEPKARPIAYTIPVMEPDDIQGFIEKENLTRFSWLKVKVNRELALPMMEEILKRVDVPLAIDGNEAWTDVEEVAKFSGLLPKDRILFLEQPLPASQKEEYRQLSLISSLPIWGDESVLNEPDPEFWQTAFAGINVKLMKAGTLQAAFDLLKTARAIGLQTMLGCMVESSIGISAAWTLESLADYVDLDGFLFLQKEPFGLVKEQNGLILRGE